jgi:hypothetical protein
MNEEKPIFVLRMSRSMSLFYLILLLFFPILLTIVAIPDLIVIAIIWIVFLILYGGVRIVMWKVASKERIEFFDTKFRMVGMDIALEGFGSLSEKEAVQEIKYSELGRFKEISDVVVKKTLFYQNGMTKPILNLRSKTPKKKELGGLRLADWIKMKANLATQTSN